jgi:hypothetical protein
LLTIQFNNPIATDLVLDMLGVNPAVPNSPQPPYPPVTFAVAQSAKAVGGNQISISGISLTGVATDPVSNPAGVVVQPSNNKDQTVGYPGRPNNQGQWVVDDTMGTVTFNPVSTFTGSPSAVTYTIADNHGNVSQPKALVALYGSAAKLTPDVVVDDNIFWDGFEMEVIYRNPAVIVFPAGEMALATLLNAYLAAFFTGAPPLLASTPADPFTTANYDTRFAQYNASPGPSPQSLYQACLDITDATIGNTAGTPYLARYWRLKVMAHLLNKTLTGSY